jgi:CheY-like chemotaxis protein
MTGSVLVVEDDDAIREAICDLLDAEGCRAIGAVNGQEALAILRREGQPCVILLDLMMPIMDGATFRAHQLEDPTLRRIPVAVVTAAGRQAAAALRFDALLLKPFRIEDLLEVVGRYCREVAT